MFCRECGTQLPNNSKFCSSCGAKLITETVTNNKNSQEIILMEGLCNYVKSKFNVQNGNAILTNKRFIYLKHSLAKTFAIGAFINLTKGSYEFDIPLSDVSYIEDGRQGISKTIVIRTQRGQDFNFYFTKREEWKIQLNNAINSVGM